MDFADKNILVTGASRGIGKAIAEAFAQNGAMVVGTATSQAGADAISDHLSQHGRGKGFVLNVTDKDSLTVLHQSLEAEALIPNVLVNNAGITRDNLLLRMSDDEWDDVIATNLTAIFRLCKLFLKPMIKARAGRIINISSVIGSTGNAGQINYASAKAGIIGFTKSMAQEVGSRGITVNAVAPGFIETDMTNALPDATQEEILKKIPLKRFGQVNDIAQTVLFLASDSANYITGETLHVNGGMYMT